VHRGCGHERRRLGYDRTLALAMGHTSNLATAGRYRFALGRRSQHRAGRQRGLQFGLAGLHADAGVRRMPPCRLRLRGACMHTISASVYDTIFARRDVRGEFTGEPVNPGVLHRVLSAAHAAPSVGLSQPWDFILVDDSNIRRDFWTHVERERQVFSADLRADRAAVFERLRVEGILDASTSLVVTYDADRGAPHVLGRHAIAETGLYSVCLAIENLWLAATAEGWGVGWVSFYREPFLHQLLELPAQVRPIAWLCLGPVTHLHEVPDLERHGWRRRVPLEAVVHHDRW
jgi:5,6-dimethylbenzimidazole synthase